MRDIARGRRLHWVIAIAVVLGVLVAIDRLSAYGAQTLLAHQIRTTRGLTDTPSVSVDGFPFLTQAIRGHYGHVQITLHGLVASQLRIEEIDADLRQVSLPLSDVIDRSVAGIPIARTTERVRLRYRDLTSYVRRQHPELTLSYGGNGLLRVTGTVRIAGHAVHASADAVVAVAGEDIAITPRRVHVVGGFLDQALSAVVRDRLTVTIPLRPLPLGQQLVSAHATAAAVEVTAAGHDVVLSTDSKERAGSVGDLVHHAQVTGGRILQRSVELGAQGAGHRT